MQARVNFKPLVGVDMEGYVDVLDILALRTTTTVRQNDGPEFGQPDGGRMAPLKLRVGFRYKN